MYQWEKYTPFNDDEAAYSFTDWHINSYDYMNYPGNIEEKLVSHQGNIVITIPKTCVYCDTTFPSRNQLFRHLGYCDVDIRPRKKKYKQVKLTKYFTSCSDYDADNEEETNNIIDVDVDVLTKLMSNMKKPNNKKIMKKNHTNKKNKKLELHELIQGIKIS